jgi:hypothetical protein
MIQGRDGPGFFLKSLAELLPASLKGDCSPQTGIDRPEYFAHSSGADSLFDFVWPEVSAVRGQGGGVEQTCSALPSRVLEQRSALIEDRLDCGTQF